MQRRIAFVAPLLNRPLQTDQERLVAAHPLSGLQQQVLSIYIASCAARKPRRVRQSLARLLDSSIESLVLSCSRQHRAHTSHASHTSRLLDGLTA
jgi:hypothetical protein